MTDRADFCCKKRETEKRMKKAIRKVLVVNSGSSSLKYQLFDMKTETRLAKGLVERIGAGGPANHAEALKKVVADLGEAASGIDAVGLFIIA